MYPSPAARTHAMRFATLHADRWSVELIAVEYDWASASKLAADNGRPNGPARSRPAM